MKSYSKPQCFQNRSCRLSHSGLILYGFQQVSRCVEILQRRGLLVIDLQSVTDHLRLIVRPGFQLAAARVAHTLHLGGQVLHMEGRAAGGADPTAAHTLHNLLIGNFQGDHGVKGDAHLFQGLGLGNGAGHPVQDKAVLAVRFRQAFGDHPDDNFIGHQLAGIHIRLGLQAKAYMDAGKLVPDEVIIGVISERLAEADCQNGFILDGVPRTIPQAEALEKVGITFDAVVSLEISDEEIVERMGGRRVCASCGAPFHVKNLPPKVEGVCDACGGKLEARADDKPEVVRDRLKVYHKETAPLKDFYAARNLLKTVENQPTVAETTTAILKALGL